MVSVTPPPQELVETVPFVGVLRPEGFKVRLLDAVGIVMHRVSTPESTSNPVAGLSI